MARVVPGLERLLDRPEPVRGLRVGLVCNPTSITRDLVHAKLALRDLLGAGLTALYAPEHGIAADAQDLIEVGHSRDCATGLPVVSLYGETRVPTGAMLEDVDAMVYDVQDVGSRYYTFIYTLLHVMEACAREKKRVVVLDRPNPLGGDSVDGNLLQLEYLSFVGMHPLVVRHGMTTGELSLLFREELALDLDLRVVPMQGWRRPMHYEDTGLPWVLPSPNMPTVDTAFVYPGGCLIEGTNLSEGRGTTRPFELVGAPWLDAHALARALQKERLPGVGFRAAAFTPTFQKHQGALCHGVQVHVHDRERFPAFLTYLLLIHHARRQDEKRFAWRDPPYEYERVKLPIDILCGTDHVRKTIEQGVSPKRLGAAFRKDAAAFRRRRRKYLLY